MSNLKINDKRKDIERYLKELITFAPHTFQAYSTNFEKKAACERYFEKIVEAVADLALLIIKERNLHMPEEENQTFDILVQAEIISSELGERLKDAKGMRNVIAHQYGSIDDQIVFSAVTRELQIDVKEFLEAVF